ncbi:MAG: hypothetical protein U0Q47_11725 [Mycobacterium sp.]
MSTAMTDTFPNMGFSSDTASGTLHGAPTMPVGALAWSEADQADQVEPAEPVVQPEAAPVVTARRPRISPVQLGALLFGGVTVVAAFGAIMLGGNDSPSTPLRVADHTQSAPYVSPAPMPTVSYLAAPAPVVASAAIPVVAPPVVAPVQPITAPPVTETPKPSQQPPHWYWLRRILQQHHNQQDGQDGQDQKR